MALTLSVSDLNQTGQAIAATEAYCATTVSLLVSLVTLKCVEATFFSVENRADGDDAPSGFGATFTSGPCHW